MKATIRIKTSYPAVFLVNGHFIEDESFIIGTDDVCYVTVLPLEATLLPYTVKCIGCKPASNLPLTRFILIKDNHYIMRLLARSNYVYSTSCPPLPEAEGLVGKFFNAVVNADTATARSMLTPELSASVDDKSLCGFFDGYDELITDNGYYLVSNDDTAHKFDFVIKGGLIDDISEL